MKNSCLLACIAGLLCLCSCEKDEGKLPNISFKTGGSYVSADKTVGQNENITIGIEASKSEDKDVLKTFDASRSFDGAAATSFLNESLSGSQGDSYSKDISITTRAQAGTEKYIFTVVNRDGLVNSVSLTLTVQ
jgi:hypothetical protein